MFSFWKVQNTHFVSTVGSNLWKQLKANFSLSVVPQFNSTPQNRKSARDLWKTPFHAVIDWPRTNRTSPATDLGYLDGRASSCLPLRNAQQPTHIHSITVVTSRRAAVVIDSALTWIHPVHLSNLCQYSPDLSPPEQTSCWFSQERMQPVIWRTSLRNHSSRSWLVASLVWPPRWVD